MWVVFVAVSLELGFLAPYGSLGDVRVYYEPWSFVAVHYGDWPGIDSAWVYPVVAILPMLLPLLAGAGNYALGWLLMVQLLNAGAFFLVLRAQRHNGTWLAAWWWIAFMLLLGALSLTRLDSVAVPFSIAGLLFAISRPRIAAALLTFATWIKVWPVALIVSVFLSRPRWSVVAVAVGGSVLILLIALTLGSGTNVLTFATSQRERGVEIGSPLATVWLWFSLAGVDNAHVLYSDSIQAFEVDGDRIAAASSVLGVLMLVAVGLVAFLAFRAQRAGVPQTSVLTTAALGLLTATIVFNKVGSPQYMAMLAVPIVVGLVYGQRQIATPAIIVGAAAGMTQIIFPWFFGELLTVAPWMLVVVTARNLLLIGLLTWSLRELVRLPRALGEKDLDKSSSRSTWPFSRQVAGGVTPGIPAE